MRPRTGGLTALTPMLVGTPAALLIGLPSWYVMVLVALSALLAAAQIVVTQIIRLRASNHVTDSHDALRVLEIEDLRSTPVNPRSRALIGPIAASNCLIMFRRSTNSVTAAIPDTGVSDGSGAPIRTRRRNRAISRTLPTR